MKRLVYPGSFDPVTNGHYDLIERASRMTDELIVAVLNNHSKRQFFSVQERKDMLRKVTAGLDNVIIDSSEELLVDYVRSVKSGFILRGLRAVSDFEYELQYAMLNQRLDKDIEAVYLMHQQRQQLFKLVHGPGNRQPGRGYFFHGARRYS